MTVGFSQQAVKPKYGFADLARHLIGDGRPTKTNLERWGRERKKTGSKNGF
jgi:hypothetical protein